MKTDFFFDVFRTNKDNQAIIWEDKSYDYTWLIKNIDLWKNKLEDLKIKNGAVTSIDASFSPYSIALLFALIEKRCIILPLYRPSISAKRKIFEISQAEFSFKVNDDDGEIKFNQLNRLATHKFYQILKKRKHPGLVLFSSGSSGEPKAAVHDFIPLLKKFKKKRKSLTTLNFLLFDHWGGLNTMFHTLANHGTLVCTENRTTRNVCRLIEKFNIELLPVSPTFLNLLLISESYKEFNLNSLKVISYGTEPMPKNVLTKLTEIFPNVTIQQTYGLIEVGVLRSKSENNESLWMKIGGEGYETRVVNSILQIKSDSAMLGYLNAPSPFTEDGWFVTGDEVEVKGEYFKILGRKSEIINVGGEKVYPTEVESIIHQMDNIAEVTVYGEKNSIVGNIVCAKVRLKKKQNQNEFSKQLKIFCQEKMKKYKVPVKIQLDNEKQYNYRFKKEKIMPKNLKI